MYQAIDKFTCWLERTLAHKFVPQAMRDIGPEATWKVYTFLLAIELRTVIKVRDRMKHQQRKRKSKGDTND